MSKPSDTTFLVKFCPICQSYQAYEASCLFAMTIALSNLSLKLEGTLFKADLFFLPQNSSYLIMFFRVQTCTPRLPKNSTTYPFGHTFYSSRKPARNHFTLVCNNNFINQVTAINIRKHFSTWLFSSFFF